MDQTEKRAKGSAKPKLKLDKIECSTCSKWTKVYGCECGDINCHKCFKVHAKTCKWAWQEAK